MPRDRDYGDPNGPGEAGISAALEMAHDEVMGPPADEVDRAIRTLTEARRVLKDGELMRAVRARLEEQRQAVDQAAGKE